MFAAHSRHSNNTPASQTDSAIRGTARVRKTNNPNWHKLSRHSHDIIIQPKLTVRGPDDEYEKEADVVANRVMRMPANEQDEESIVQTKQINSPAIQRFCSECEEDREEGQAAEVQAKAEQPASPDTSSNSVYKALNLSGGAPLHDSVRSRIEPALNTDLSHVRVHSGSTAQTAAQSINARAFTHQNNIYLGSGQSATDTKLMAHEATHVVQQGSMDKPELQRWASHEFYCASPKEITYFSDKKLIDEITKINAGYTRGRCLNKSTETELDYLNDLKTETLMRPRALLTRPTGIKSTIAGSVLDYGVELTHTLSLSPGGKSSDLIGSEITENIDLVRDDFGHGKAKEDKWVLGKIGSISGDTFIDSILTGGTHVRNQCRDKEFKTLPPVREERQKYYWRKFKDGVWEPKPVANNRIIFKVAYDFNTKSFNAITIYNGVTYKQPYNGLRPRQK